MRLPSAFIVTTTTANIQYKVISLIPNNETIAVFIDGDLYPLIPASNISKLLHIGKAPVAISGYKYVILSKKDNHVVKEEPFIRAPVEINTFNEHFGRSWNKKVLNKLPIIMDPLPIIHRIDSDLHIDGQIPTIHITGDQTALNNMHFKRNEDIKISMNMVYISLDNIEFFENITFSISGQSTRRSSKVSYKFTLPKKHDLYGYRRFKLRAMSTDTSYMREEIAHKVTESIGLPSSKFSYVRLYVNDIPLGLFGLVENFKNPWVRNEFSNGSKKFKQGSFYIADLNGGRGITPDSLQEEKLRKRPTKSVEYPFSPIHYETIYKKGFSHYNTVDKYTDIHENADIEDTPELHRGPREVRGNMSDLSYIGSNLALYSEYYSLKEKPSSGKANYARIMELAKFISEQPNNTFADDSVVPLWQEKLDTDSVLRSLAFELVMSNADGYLTMGNNYILYEDLENNRLIMSEQDLDLTMGKTIFNATLVNGANWTAFPGFTVKPLSSRMYHVPQFREELNSLILKYTKKIMNPNILFPFIDQLYDMLKEDVAWDKTLPRVLPEIPFGNGGLRNRRNTSFDTAVNGHTGDPQSLGLKEWVSLRSSNLLKYYNESL
ncbi:coth protein-domain-containing protein [Cokeromyces recurvatus]|uniref:coth protein-domain-containing protein n=1 Tax=Cokeromyces recurvatus TaxID=90255 RepID=UPI00221EC1E3|nr:coth protein-domain-containing protein [Cokeromyces recurvatus]KAI7905160.1 coth protein-domain-containing protein [Cokeromyces recurvatus]